MHKTVQWLGKEIAYAELQGDKPFDLKFVFCIADILKAQNASDLLLAEQELYDDRWKKGSFSANNVFGLKTMIDPQNFFLELKENKPEFDRIVGEFITFAYNELQGKIHESPTLSLPTRQS